MQTVKWVHIKLFYSRSGNVFYIQLGENLYIITERIARIISEKEGMEIRTGDDLKAIQIMSLEDKKEQK